MSAVLVSLPECSQKKSSIAFISSKIGVTFKVARPPIHHVKYPLYHLISLNYTWKRYIGLPSTGDIYRRTHFLVPCYRSCEWDVLHTSEICKLCLWDQMDICLLSMYLFEGEINIICRISKLTFTLRRQDLISGENKAQEPIQHWAPNLWNLAVPIRRNALWNLDQSCH